MDIKQKPSGQVIQQNEEVTGSDLADVNGETGPVLKMTFVDGKNPEVRNIPLSTNSEISDPSGPTV